MLLPTEQLTTIAIKVLRFVDCSNAHVVCDFLYKKVFKHTG